MSDFKLLSTAELVTMCKDFVARKTPSEPDPLHEGWDGNLVITPRMVQDILDANTEV
jgi:hypothetical protein